MEETDMKRNFHHNQRYKLPSKVVGGGTADLS